MALLCDLPPLPAIRPRCTWFASGALDATFAWFAPTALNNFRHPCVRVLVKRPTNLGQWGGGLWPPYPPPLATPLERDGPLWITTKSGWVPPLGLLSQYHFRCVDVTLHCFDIIFQQEWPTVSLTVRKKYASQKEQMQQVSVALIASFAIVREKWLTAIISIHLSHTIKSTTFKIGLDQATIAWQLSYGF